MICSPKISGSLSVPVCEVDENTQPVKIRNHTGQRDKPAFPMIQWNGTGYRPPNQTMGNWIHRTYAEHVLSQHSRRSLESFLAQRDWVEVKNLRD